MQVVFPLLCHTDDDEELWNEDPYEYIRMKFGKLQLIAVTIVISFKHRESVVYLYNITETIKKDDANYGCFKLCKPIN